MLAQKPAVTPPPPERRPLNRQPVLTDGVVRLRPLRAADRPALAAAASDPLIWAGHVDPERYGPTFARYFDDNLASGGALVIEDVASGAAIGQTRYQTLYTSHDGGVEVADVVEVGWTFLTRAYWGGTTNRRVKRLLVAHAAAVGRRVVLHIAAANGRSRAAAERLGGVILGEEAPVGWRSPKPDYTNYLLPAELEPPD